MQRRQKIWELRGEPTTMVDNDKFLESFEDNCPRACDGRSVWMIDCEKLDGSDQDKNLGDTCWSKLEDHEVYFFGSEDYHEQHGHLYV